MNPPRREGTVVPVPSPLVRGEGARRADEGLSLPQSWHSRHSVASNDTPCEVAPHPNPLPPAMNPPRREGTVVPVPSPLVRGEGARRADEGLSLPQSWRSHHSVASNDTPREVAPHPNPLPAAMNPPRREGTVVPVPSPLVRGEGARRADEGLSLPQSWRSRHSVARDDRVVSGSAAPQGVRRSLSARDRVQLVHDLVHRVIAQLLRIGDEQVQRRRVESCRRELAHQRNRG